MVFQQLREQLDGNLQLSLVVLLSAVGLYHLGSYPLSLLQVVLTFTPLSYPFRYDLSKLRKPSPSSSSTSGKGGGEGPFWVVVTGATGDIGKEFAFQLARKGFSIFLVGRTKTKLATLADEVLSVAKGRKHGANVQTDWHPIDLEKATEADWVKFEHAVASLPGQIVVLINNAGVSHHVPVPFESTPTEELATIPAVNVVAVLRLTRIVLPRMLQNGKKGGAVFNIGSFSSLVPTPCLATYAGTKGFLYTWSQALGEELKEKNILVRLLNPYFVVTAMSRIKKPTFMIPTPKAWVRSALSYPGLPGGALSHPYISTPYLSHALAQWSIEHLMSENWWLAYNLRMQKATMKRFEARRRRLEAEEKAEAEGKVKAA